jgi:drug/metabolite transporter (DMT)-like permease
MRYSLVFLILTILMLAMPVHRHHGAQARSSVATQLLPQHQWSLPSWDAMFSQQTQTEVNKAMTDLRALPAAQQLLFLVQVIVLMMCGASVISYVLHSIASLAGFSLTLTLLVIFTALLVYGTITRRRKPRLLKWMERHTEMGPFIRRLKARGWQKRFKRAARAHGLRNQQPQLARVRVQVR